MKNNAYRFNPFYRNVEFPKFESNPNAELPESLTFNELVDSICGATSSGKLWDDSEVSDQEMDAMIDQMNAMNGMGGCDSETHKLNIGSSIRFFR